mgnify:CR=1 FL=1
MVGRHLSPHTTKLAAVLGHLGRVDVSYLFANVKLGIVRVVHIVHLDQASVVVCVAATPSIAQDRSLDVQACRLWSERRAKADGEGGERRGGIDTLAKVIRV